MSKKPHTSYNKNPKTPIASYQTGIISGNQTIATHIKQHHPKAKTIVIECYPGVRYDVLKETFFSHFEHTPICVDDYALEPKELDHKLHDHLTDDRVFGRMSQYQIEEFYPSDAKSKIDTTRKNHAQTIIYGFGASRFVQGDLILYLDLTRWDIKTRYRNGMQNWRSEMKQNDKLRKEKRGFFIEWRTADRIKKTVFPQIDYYLDCSVESALKMITHADFFKALKTTTAQPFSMVPYFDPGVWGGQWMKDVCDLDKRKENFAWSFNGVMEENAIHYQFGSDFLASPAINIVLFEPVRLLGDKVHARFGTEFPIRFDFLDTIGGQNLSLQVHPLTEYIQETFGMAYTQDESYYILDADDGGVYLGLKEGIDKKQMIHDLKQAEKGKKSFDADKYINRFSVKKHDHISLPAGTIHCSAKGTMVLEISATPYIFTFKMWDWGRLGLDGLPRPIHLDHALQNIVWDRTTDWVKKELINPIETIQKNDTILEEHTGLHQRQFIETRRHTHQGKVQHNTHDSVNVLILVEGQSALVESPEDAFEPFEVHYAETFIIPEHVKTYTIRPMDHVSTPIKTIKAYVRT